MIKQIQKQKNAIESQDKNFRRNLELQENALKEINRAKTILVEDTRITDILQHSDDENGDENDILKDKRNFVWSSERHKYHNWAKKAQKSLNKHIEKQENNINSLKEHIQAQYKVRIH